MSELVIIPTAVEPEAVSSDDTAVTPIAAVVEKTEETVEKAVSTSTVKDEKKLAALAASVKRTNELMVELGIGVAETQDSEGTVETVVEKSEVADTQTDFDAVISKALAAQAVVFNAQIEEIKALIPATQVPGILVSKSKDEEFAEMLSTMDVHDRLLVGLAGMQRK